MKLQPLNKTLAIQAPKSLGVTASIYLHEKARKLPSYQTEIQSDGYGVDKNGEIIRVDTLGRWLFGVPGYEGHLRVVPQDKVLIVHYSDKASEMVENFLQELKRVVEQT